MFHVEINITTKGLGALCREGRGEDVMVASQVGHNWTGHLPGKVSEGKVSRESVRN